MGVRGAAAKIKIKTRRGRGPDLRRFEVTAHDVARRSALRPRRLSPRSQAIEQCNPERFRQLVAARDAVGPVGGEQLALHRVLLGPKHRPVAAATTVPGTVTLVLGAGVRPDAHSTTGTA